jgi:SAM-dependent methyltransferase
VTGSGLVDRLIAAGQLIPHESAPLELAADPSRAHAVIRPVEIPMLSYPYEWSFGMLRDAALLTLDVQAEAAAVGFTLRDASAFNVQFARGRPILIDTLSIAPAEPDAPWAAYRQFCEHFLAPLALMARRDIRLGQLLRTSLDGVPLDLAASLLPARTRFSTGLGPHLHLHARSQRRYQRGGEAAGTAARQAKVGPTRAEALIDSLRRTVSGLEWRPEGTEWADYERADPARAAVVAKDEIVRSMLASAGGEIVWDLGANVGRHSAIAAELGRRVVAWDVDAAAVERHYRAIRNRAEERVLPLLVDLAKPTPALGWGLKERRSFLERADADAVLALALIHHLAIGRNVPLPRVADLFARLAPNAIVEWVGRDDPMVRRLLATREDIFDSYTLDGFRSAFGGPFELVDEQPVPGTERRIVRMVRR